jgi:hypothetical protein
MEENEKQEIPQSRCSAGLKIGEYVSRLSDWCGKDGSRLGACISNRMSQYSTPYPDVVTDARVIVEQTEKTFVVQLEDPYVSVNKVATVKRTIPKSFMCSGYRAFVGPGGKHEDKKTCEGCPFERS